MCDIICRLCLKDLDADDPDGGSILDEKIRKAMNNVFCFKVCFEAELPQNICKQCSWNVQDFECFSELVEKNQKILKQKYLPMESPHYTEDESTEQVDQESCVQEPSTQSQLATVSSSTVSDIYLDSNVYDKPLVDMAYKTELDEVDVVDEFHPDLMETSITGIEQWRTIMTCGDYKISSDYDTTESSSNEENVENFLEIMEENNNPHNEPSKGKLNKQVEKDCLRSLSNHCPPDTNDKEQYACMVPSQDSLKTSNDKENVSKNNDKGEFVCGECGQTFVIKRKLYAHRQNHQLQKCVICSKTLKRKSFQRHLLTHKRENIEKDLKKKYRNKPH
uniref:C2H2-type domain-containing protein n=1 Tax=Anopheles gambiae TaxID=7165 RepID=A0A453YZC0_ANOGA